MEATENPDAFAQLSALEEKRLLLQQLLRIAQSLDDLQSGLTAVLDLNRGLLQRQEADRHLDAELKRLLNAELHDRNQRLERRLKAMLRVVLSVAEEIDHTRVDETTRTRMDEVHQLIADFVKLAHTAVAIRALLKKRGQSPAPFRSPVTAEEIEQRIDLVAAKEESCRLQVVRDITEMQRDIGVLLRNPGLSPAIQGMLDSVRTDLDRNLDHLRAGKSVSTLPVPVDIIDFSGIQMFSPVAAATAEMPREQVTDETPAAPIGFWRALWTWINTPWSVGWKEARKTKRK